MTLIEMTVVILVMMSLIVLLFVGARAWKRGSDRAGCLVNLRQVQISLRSLSNLEEFEPGQNVAPFDVEGGLFGSDNYIWDKPDCPSGGTYTYGGNVIPPMGQLYATCSLNVDLDHEPEDPSAW